MIKQDRGTPFSQTATGTAAATATQTVGTQSAIYYVTDIEASTTTGAGTYTLYGSTVSVLTTLWQGQIPSAANYSKVFSTPIPASPNAAIKLVANGTVATYANVSGFIINIT